MYIYIYIYRDSGKLTDFYLLPKILKMNNLGRPVIIFINCQTTKLSKYVDHYIQSLPEEVKSYIWQQYIHLGCSYFLPIKCGYLGFIID